MSTSLEWGAGSAEPSRYARSTLDASLGLLLLGAMNDVFASKPTETADAAPPEPGPDEFRMAVQHCCLVDLGSPAASVTVTVGVRLFPDGKPDTLSITLLDASGDDGATRKAFEGVGSGKSRGRWREATEGYVQWCRYLGDDGMTMRSALLAATVLAGFAAGAAEAQQRSFRSLDANGDGRLTQEELSAAFGAAGAARVLERQDRDGDGTLTRSEGRASSTGDEDGRGDDDDGRGGDDDDDRDDDEDDRGDDDRDDDRVGSDDDDGGDDDDDGDDDE